MVIDLKRIQLRNDILDNALWVVEQIPSLVAAADQTAILRAGRARKTPWFCAVIAIRCLYHSCCDFQTDSSQTVHLFQQTSVSSWYVHLVMKLSHFPLLFLPDFPMLICHLFISVFLFLQYLFIVQHLPSTGVAILWPAYCGPEDICGPAWGQVLHVEACSELEKRSINCGLRYTVK